jgi:hypothetical protein
MEQEDKPSLGTILATRTAAIASFDPEIDADGSVAGNSD